MYFVATVGPYMESLGTWSQRDKMADEEYVTAWFDAFGFYLVMTMALPFVASVARMRRPPYLALIFTSVAPPGLVYISISPLTNRASLVSLWILAIAGSLAIYHSLDTTTRDWVEKERAHERYVAALSHDFGTPISALQMATRQLAALIQPSASPKAEAELGMLLQGMHAALELMASLKRKAVDVGKLQYGEALIAERAPVDLRELMHEKLGSLVHYIPHAHSVRVDIRVDDAIETTINTDGSWLFMMLLNLVSNAFKATRSGSVTVVAQLVGGKLRLLVADTGVGLSAEGEQQLWQAFQQASRWQSGSGLGLYHVKELATALGGSVGYQPNLQAGNGAVFWVDVPYSPTAVPAPLTKSGGGSPLLPSTALAEHAVCKTVLLAEDNLFIRELTRELLLSVGVEQVVLAANGSEALSVLSAADAPDISLVLMDVQMPFMDGIECTRRFRAWEQARQAAAPLTIIALTANGNDLACQRDCRLAGMDGVLCKPIDVNVLRQMVQSQAVPAFTDGVANPSAPSAPPSKQPVAPDCRRRGCSIGAATLSAHASSSHTMPSEGASESDDCTSHGDPASRDDSFSRLAKTLMREATAANNREATAVNCSVGPSPQATGASSAEGGQPHAAVASGWDVRTALHSSPLTPVERDSPRATALESRGPRGANAISADATSANATGTGGDAMGSNAMGADAMGAVLRGAVTMAAAAGGAAAGGAAAGGAVEAPPSFERDTEAAPLVFDLACVLESVGGSDAAARRIIERFYTSEQPQMNGALLASIEAAVTRGEVRAVRELAHALKGACGYVGAFALQAAATTLEQAAHKAAEHASSDLHLEMAPYVARVSAELRALLDQQAAFLRAELGVAHAPACAAVTAGVQIRTV